MKVELKPSVADRPNVQGWLKVGSPYLVLAIETITGGQVAYRIESEDNQTPALFEANLFRLVDSRLPACWIAVQGEDGPVQFMPASWSNPGFWERFFDGDPDARQIYDDAVSLISDQSGLGDAT